MGVVALRAPALLHGRVNGSPFHEPPVTGSAIVLGHSLQHVFCPGGVRVVALCAPSVKDCSSVQAAPFPLVAPRTQLHRGTLRKPGPRRRVWVVARQALTFACRVVDKSFAGGWVLVTLETKKGNRFGKLPGSLWEMHIVAHCALLACDRFVHVAVLEKFFMAILGSRRHSKGQGQEGQGEADGDFSVRKHPGISITTPFLCQLESQIQTQTQ